MLKKSVCCFIILSTFLFLSSAMAAQPTYEEQLIKLGKQIYENKELSVQRPQSCQTCHHPNAGFADPDNAKQPFRFPVSEGSVPKLFGGRNAPTAAYSGFSPIFHYECEGDDCLFIGGVFWDGRASGTEHTATAEINEMPTGDPIADQAKGPFLNPIEMGLGSPNEVVDIVLASDAGGLFLKLYGPFDPALDYPDAYNFIAIAIAAFERSGEVNRFGSLFDKFVAEQRELRDDPSWDPSEFGIVFETDGFRTYEGPGDTVSKYLSQDQLIGLALFNADSDNLGTGGRVGGMCYACHPTSDHVVDGGDPYSIMPADTYSALFTDFSYDNLGMPANQTAIDLFELSGDNVYATDLGLGGQIMIMEDALDDAGEDYYYPGDEPNGINIVELAASLDGAFKVSGLRGVAETAPYGHNGYFPTLLSIVHFYNTADVDAISEIDWCEDALLPAHDAMVAGCWPYPETGDPNRDELGNLGLSPTQEMQLVMFLEALSDAK